MIDAAMPLHRRILVVDDNRAIHEDFRKILAAPGQGSAGLSAAEAALFGEAAPDAASPPAPFQIDGAFQGSEALDLVRRALAEGRPYAVAFMDVRMPPGWDGVETTSRIWQLDPELQIVICTAYSDYSWDEMLARLGQSDRLVILKKPFDTIEVLQLANALAEKWRLAREHRRMLLDLEDRIAERTTELRTSGRLLAEAEAIANLGSWAWDVRADRVTWSEELLHIFGLPADQAPVSLEPSLALIQPGDRERLRDALLAAVEGAGPFELEVGMSRSGDRRVLHCRGVAQAGPDGRTERMVGVCQDVTEARRAELELSRSHRALRMLSACNEALIRVQNEQALLERVCRIAVDLGGYSMAWVGYAGTGPQHALEIVAHSGMAGASTGDTELSWNEARTGGGAPAARAIRGSEVIVVEDLAGARVADPVGDLLESRPRGAVSLPLLDDSRTFGALTLYTAEAAVMTGEEIRLLQELADNLAFGISAMRARAERRNSEEAVLKIARGVSDGTGSEFFDLLTATLVEVLAADGGLVGRIAGPGTIETFSLIVDGHRRANSSYPLAGSPSEQVLTHGHYVVERDAQQRHPASRMLRDHGVSGYAGIRLRSWAGQSLGVLAVMFHDAVSRPEHVLSILRIFAGRAGAELERQETERQLREQASLLDKAHDAIIVRGIDDRIRFWNKGAEAVFGWTAEEAVGRSMEELLCAEPGLFNEALVGAMERGEWSGNIAGQRRKDGRLATVASHWSLVRNEAGRPLAILSINTDITERLAIDQRLQQSQRLEAVGQLTGGVAHDFNNLLTVIQGNSELLVEELETQPALRSLAEMIGTAARRGADLTHRLLAFARKQALEPRVVDAQQLLDGMEALLRRTLREDIELRIDHDDGLWAALVDPSQLEGAVLNLCLNARDAMERGGRLTIETANAWRDPDYPGQLADMRPGRYVMVAVSDTGKGIPPENLPRVFEPFFTTKEFGKGTGLGLSMVYGFVRQSQGHVTIYSEAGQGTTVRMYLPAADGRAEALDEGPADIASLRGSEKILLAEDDELVRAFAEGQLRDLGYRVVAARNGTEALEHVRTTPDIDLLLTDVVMPGGLGGPELAAAARAERPGLRVLFCSGYTEGAILHGGRLDGSAHILNKPYRRIELARKVRSALSAPPA